MKVERSGVEILVLSMIFSILGTEFLRLVDNFADMVMKLLYNFCNLVHNYLHAQCDLASITSIRRLFGDQILSGQLNRTGQDGGATNLILLRDGRTGTVYKTAVVPCLHLHTNPAVQVSRPLPKSISKLYPSDFSYLASSLLHVFAHLLCRRCFYHLFL